MAGVGCASLMLCTCAIDHRLGSLLLTSPPLTRTFDTLRARHLLLQEITTTTTPTRLAFDAALGAGCHGCGLVCVDGVAGRCTLAVSCDEYRWQDDSPYCEYDCVSGESAVVAFLERCEAARGHGGPIPVGWAAVDVVETAGVGRVGLGVGGVMLWFDLLRSRWGYKDQRGVF